MAEHTKRKRILKRTIALCGSVVMAASSLALDHVEASAAAASLIPTASVGIAQLEGLDTRNATAVGGVEPYSVYWFNTEQKVSVDLSSHKELAYSLTFSDKTKFSKLPADMEQQEVLEWGKAPGLGVDILHKHGFDGTGATIAYIDQPIADHEQYRDLKLHYENQATDSDNSMHGPAVLSLLAGKDIGTAPGAEVYFYGHATWLRDQTTHASCLYAIIEQNKKLPAGKKIRMVGFSDNIDPTEANEVAFRKAVKACEDAGIMVWFCGEYSSAVFAPESDRNNPENVYPDLWGMEDPELVYVPAGSRTTAATQQSSNYIYWGSGGLSWTMPYALGIYADALAIDPTLTQEEIRTLIVDTAYVNARGLRIICPIEFIAAVLESKGRDAEAETLRREYKAELKYVYAVMNRSQMSQADITQAEKNLQGIKGVTVLEVDASRFSTSSALYSALKKDAAARGGKTVGIQIFGNSTAVPAFDVQYRVQMQNEIDEAGMLKTDLFYGNFRNDIENLDQSYSVYDQFKQNRNIVLAPEWPVVRLPLSRGQYENYFKNVEEYANKTRYERSVLVNFSNPIFATESENAIDNMRVFLDRAKDEFGFLKKDQYRLYGNFWGIIRLLQRGFWVDLQQRI